ncbi:hypothetical protein OQA88_8090 [Cercophora sp. LCS_1]
MAVYQLVESQAYSHSTPPKPSKKQVKRAEGAVRVSNYTSDSVIARIQFSPSISAGNASGVDQPEGLKDFVESLAHTITQGGN